MAACQTDQMGDLATLDDQPVTDAVPQSRMTPSARKMLGSLTVFGFVIPVASYFWLIHHYGVNDVYLDQWGDVGIMRHSYTGTLTLGTLWSQHGEERLLFPNLVVLALGYVTHLNIVVEEYVSAVLLCLSTLLLIVSHKRRSSRGWLWYCPVPILTLSLVQSFSTLFGFQLAWYLLIFMLALALYLLDKSPLSNWTLAGAMVVAVVGSFSSLPRPAHLACRSDSAVSATPSGGADDCVVSSCPTRQFSHTRITTTPAKVFRLTCRVSISLEPPSARSSGSSAVFSEFM